MAGRCRERASQPDWRKRCCTTSHRCCAFGLSCAGQRTPGLVMSKASRARRTEPARASADADEFRSGFPVLCTDERTEGVAREPAVGDEPRQVRQIEHQKRISALVFEGLVAGDVVKGIIDEGAVERISADRELQR